MPTRNDPVVAIHGMLSAIEGIRRTAGLDPNPATGDWTRLRAIERGFEIVSEGSRRIPDATKDSEPEIPWRSIAGIGNVLRHEYDAVAPAILVAAIERDLPPLKLPCGECLSVSVAGMLAEYPRIKRWSDRPAGPFVRLERLCHGDGRLPIYHLFPGVLR